MKTKQIIAGISAAAVFAMGTPAYAGGLFGGGAGALGGSMTSGIGGMTGQGAFDGRGAASTSFDRFPERPTPRIKPATTGAAATGAESAQRSSGTANALRGSAAHEADGSVATALGQASGQSSSTTNAAGQMPPRAASTALSTAGSAAGSASMPAASAPAATTPAATTPAPAAKTPSSTSASSSPSPSVMTSAAGAGSIDAQHSRGDNSVAVSGEAGGSASRTE
jgi:hypothetical protein